jgi:hypothetical protein
MSESAHKSNYWVFALVAVLLIAVSSLGTAVFFLSKGSAPQINYQPTSLAVAGQYEGAASIAEQASVTPSAEEQIDPKDLVIPPESNPEEAKGILVAELSKMPGVYVGNGSNEIMVLFDPMCKECHSLYFKLTNGYAKKFDLKVKFIPTLIFDGNQLSRTLSLYLNDLVLNNDIKGATEYLKTIMDLTPGAMKDGWIPSKQSQYFYNRATIATYQIIMGHPKAGTPIFIFKNKTTGKVGMLTGQPFDEDFAEMTGLK